ncbi:MAG: gliding motility-associated C-terminal domain-containing protein [Bacteroidota bacterium]
MKKLYFALLLGFFQLSFSQLSNFNLQVTPTNETCSGNGTLSFFVTNTTAGATIVYNIFLLPNTTTPIAITTDSSLTGLSSGNYQVIATQSLGANSNSQQQNVTITNQIQNLTFTISDQMVKCGNDGVLTANVTSGNAVSYQILTGPVTTPIQSSNVFSNLPVGNYSIRVYDTCGNAVVNSFTLTGNYTPFLIYFVDEINLTCNDITLDVSTNYSNSNVAYPLNVEIKVYPPNNATPLIFQQTVTSFSALGIKQIIPRYDGNYFYDVKIIDGCGNPTVLNNVFINNDFGFSVMNLQGCTPKIKITPVNVIYPYTIEFLSAPANFDPYSLNPGFPGPYSTPYVELFVIEGNYTVKLTDACGKTKTVNFQVTTPETPVLSLVSSDGCGGISFSINQIHSVTIENVTLISAPAAYQGTLPQDLSAFIDALGFNWGQTGFPVGSYVFHILDSCGVLHVKNVTIGVGQAVSISVVNYPECNLGFGSVYVYYNSNAVSTVKITAAPNNFPFPLPYALPAVGSSAYALINVPVGSYSIEMTSTCGNPQTNIFNVESYSDSNTTFEIEQFCSSFNLKFTQQGNGFAPTYALQKFNEIAGVWEHPVTGDQIIGNQINANNFYTIIHNQWNINLQFLGKFRIIEAYRTISYDVCVRPIQEFEVSGQPKVLNHNVVNCGSGTSVVQLNAVGIGQLIYRITQKNNLPFLVNNGTNNVFVNLDPAIYNFQIEDACGNILNHQIQIITSFPIQIVPDLCENQLSSLSADTYSFLQYEWWKDGSPSNILSTTSVLSFNPFVTSTHSGLYHLKITHIGNPTSCLNGVMTYTISTQATPMAGLDKTVNLCGLQNSITLNSYLSGTFDLNGVWEEITMSNGVLNNGIWNASTVNYGVYKFKYLVNGFCGSIDEAIITIQIIEKPVLNSMPLSYTVCLNDNLEINPALSNPNYSYQWIGPNNFTSTNSALQLNAVQTVSSGQYSLIVGDNGCFSDAFNFVVDVTSLPDFYVSEICENNIKTLVAIPVNGVFDSSLNLSWTGPNGFNSSSNPIQINDEGDYTLTIDKNTCEIFKEVTINNITCSIPKGISPNGDGSNDFFDLSGFDVETIKIFNRYGLEIYSKEGYLNEWYGQANNGNLLPAATYFYALKLKSGESKTGWIYVMR